MPTPARAPPALVRVLIGAGVVFVGVALLVFEPWTLVVDRRVAEPVPAAVVLPAARGSVVVLQPDGSRPPTSTSRRSPA